MEEAIFNTVAFKSAIKQAQVKKVVKLLFN